MEREGWGTHRQARGMEVYPGSAGGQGGWVLAEQAVTAAKNDRADISTGQEQDRALGPGPGSPAYSISTDIPMSMPHLLPSRVALSQGLEVVPQLQ